METVALDLTPQGKAHFGALIPPPRVLGIFYVQRCRTAIKLADLLASVTFAAALITAPPTIFDAVATSVFTGACANASAVVSTSSHF